MAKTVADLIIERLIAGVLIRFLGYPAMVLTGSLRRCAPIRTRSGLSRCVMKKPPPLPPVAMPSIPAALASVWRP